MAMIEHALVVGDQGRPSVAEVAAGHRFLAELPPIAVRVAAFGRGSVRSGRRPGWVSSVCRFEYLGASASGEIRFCAPALGTAAPGVFSGQLELFRETVDPALTAFSLLGEGVWDLLREEADSDRFDDAWLRKFARITTVAFKQGARLIRLEGLQREATTLALDPRAPQSARHLLERIPSPIAVRVAGRLTLLKVRGEIFEVTVDDGQTVRCSHARGSVESLRSLFNTHVVVSGMAVFRPSGRLLRVDADAIEEAGSSDQIFSHVPAHPRLVPDRVRELGVRPVGPSWLARIRGKWPGNETEEQLLHVLRQP